MLLSDFLTEGLGFLFDGLLVLCLQFHLHVEHVLHGVGLLPALLFCTYGDLGRKLSVEARVLLVRLSEALLVSLNTTLRLEEIFVDVSDNGILLCSSVVSNVGGPVENFRNDIFSRSIRSVTLGALLLSLLQSAVLLSDVLQMKTALSLQLSILLISSSNRIFDLPALLNITHLLRVDLIVLSFVLRLELVAGVDAL